MKLISINVATDKETSPEVANVLNELGEFIQPITGKLYFIRTNASLTAVNAKLAAAIQDTGQAYYVAECASHLVGKFPDYVQSWLFAKAA